MKALIALEERAEERFLELNANVDGPLDCFGVDGKQLSAWSNRSSRHLSVLDDS